MNIAIIPGLLYDDDFKFFNEETYAALDGVLNDVLAGMIRKYLNNPDADPEVIEAMRTTITPTVKSYTLHLELEERNIFELLNNLQPESILQTDASYRAHVLDSLLYLNDNVKNVIATIPARTRAKYDAWRRALSSVQATMQAQGASWKVPNMMTIMEANKSLFFEPREKDRYLPSNSVLNKKDKWLMALRALQWDNYCTQHGVGMESRLSF